MRRNQVQLFVETHPRLCQKVGRRIDDGAVGQGFMHRQQGFQLAIAGLALCQMLLQRGQVLIRQLTVSYKDDILLRIFALHCSTSTSLKEFPLLWVYPACPFVLHFPNSLRG